MEYITHVETNKRTLFWTFIRYIRYAMSFLCLNMQKKTGKQQKKYTVAVCAIFKNESVFLKEWLEYHLLIGVEHFYPGKGEDPVQKYYRDAGWQDSCRQ